MAAQDNHEYVLTSAATTEEVPKGADESDLGEVNRAHQSRCGRLPARAGAAAAVLVLLGVAAAWRLSGVSGAGNGEAAEAVEKGDAESLAAVGPFGEYAGPAPPFNTKQNSWGVPAANMGSPPRPHEPESHKPPGCQGTGCNGGKLCCGKDAVCCGTSCCSGGSICCNANLGLCCAEGTMCCFRKFCCSPSFKCGDSRTKTGGLRFEILEACGGGAQIRRLMDQVRHRQEFRKLLSTNETGLKELLGVPIDQDEADEK